MEAQTKLAEQLGSSPVGKMSATYMLAVNALNRAKGNVDRALPAMIKSLAGRNVDINALFSQRAIENAARKMLEQVALDQSGTVLSHKATGIRSAASANGQSGANSAFKEYVHPSLVRWDEEVPDIGIGHNSHSTAFDAGKVLNAEKFTRHQAAKTLADTWRLSNGHLVCKLSLNDLRRHDKDGTICRILHSAIKEKYANADGSQCAEDLLTAKELKACHELAKSETRK